MCKPRIRIQGVNRMQELNRNLLVGMFILGAMSHYDADEVEKHKDIRYIAETLRKKHFNIKNGDAKTRYIANPSTTEMLMRKTKDVKKRANLLKQGQNAQKRMIDNANCWATHAKISDEAWIKAAKAFPATNAITVNQLILALLRKEEKMKKWYGFNDKKLAKYSKVTADAHIFSSSRVATALIKELDAEIAYYYFNKQLVA